MESSPHPA